MDIVACLCDEHATKKAIDDQLLPDSPRNGHIGLKNTQNSLLPAATFGWKLLPIPLTNTQQKEQFKLIDRIPLSTPPLASHVLRLSYLTGIAATRKRTTNKRAFYYSVIPTGKNGGV